MEVYFILTWDVVYHPALLGLWLEGIQLRPETNNEI